MRELDDKVARVQTYEEANGGIFSISLHLYREYEERIGLKLKIYILEFKYCLSNNSYQPLTIRVNELHFVWLIDQKFGELL